MALPSTNDFTGRIWRIVAVGNIPFANFKVKGGVWTGGTAGQTASFVDVAGREYDFVYPSSGNALNIGEMGWVSGPAAITAMPSGEMQWWVGTK
jgi:hypothetical protein